MKEEGDRQNLSTTKAFLLIIVVKVIMADLSQNFEENSSQQELKYMNSVVALINKHFRDFHVVIFNAYQYSGKFTNELIKLIKRDPLPILIIHEAMDLDSYDMFSAVDSTENSVGFITITSFVDFEICYVSTDLRNSSFWNSRTSFLLVVTSPLHCCREAFLRIFRDCWDSYNILNLVVVFRSSNENNVFYVVTYNPFLRSVHVSDIHKSWETGDGINPFPSKLENTHGYVFNVTLTPQTPMLFVGVDPSGKKFYYGPNGIAINTVVEKFNGIMNVIPAIPSFTTTDKKYSKTLFANEFPLLGVFKPAAAYPHDQECFTLIAPKAEQIPKYMNLILPFTKTSWLVHFLTVSVIGICWKIIVRFDRELESVHGISVETIRLSIWGGTERKPQYFVQRWLVLLIVVLNLIMSNSYQGSLASYLTTPHFYPDINSIDELGEGISISFFLAGEDLNTMYENFEVDDLYAVIAYRMVAIPNASVALSMAAMYKNVTRISYKGPAKAAVAQPEYFRDGFPLLHVLEDCFLKLPQIFRSVTPDNPFLARMNTILIRLKEGGFIFKWFSDHVEDGKRKTASNSFVVEPMPVTFNHLYIPFCILGVGLCVSLLVLFFEILFYKISIFKKSIYYKYFVLIK